MATQDSRIRVKRGTTTGDIPTVPASSDHTDGTWTNKDLYVGELYLNTADDRLWIRTDNGVKEIALGVGELKTTTFSLTSAQILALNTTPLTVVSAIAGKEIQVVSASAALTYVSSTYATNTNMVLKSSSASNEQARFDISSGSTASGTFENMVYNNNIVSGDALVVSVDGGDPTAGDGTMELSITYRVTDL